MSMVDAPAHVQNVWFIELTTLYISQRTAGKSQHVVICNTSFWVTVLLQFYFVEPFLNKLESVGRKLY